MPTSQVTLVIFSTAAVLLPISISYFEFLWWWREHVLGPPRSWGCCVPPHETPELPGCPCSQAGGLSIRSSWALHWPVYPPPASRVGAHSVHPQKTGCLGVDLNPTDLEKPVSETASSLSGLLNSCLPRIPWWVTVPNQTPRLSCSLFKKQRLVYEAQLLFQQTFLIRAA